MKNLKYSFMFVVAVSLLQNAHASVTDQAAHDMLTASSDDENADQVSRWGDTTQKRKRAEDSKQVFSFSPIGEGSFEQLGSGGRAPASVRGPAGSVDGVVIQATDTRAAPKAVARAAVNKKAVQEVSVIANDYGFFPSTIFVTQGIPVRLFITGASQRSQCFMLDQFGVRRQIRSQKIEEITFTPDQSGNFVFTCPMNGAKGSVVVKELEVGARAPASAAPSVAVRETKEEGAASSFDQPEPKKSLIKDEDFGI